MDGAAEGDDLRAGGGVEDGAVGRGGGIDPVGSAAVVPVERVIPAYWWRGN